MLFLWTAGLSHPPALFRRVWEGPSHGQVLLTHPQKTAWVAPQTLSRMAHWVGGDGKSGVCFVCPVLVIPVWEQSAGQECKPLPASLPLHFLPYQEAPSIAGPFPLQALPSPVATILMLPSPCP